MLIRQILTCITNALAYHCKLLKICCTSKFYNIGSFFLPFLQFSQFLHPLLCVMLRFITLTSGFYCPNFWPLYSVLLLIFTLKTKKVILTYLTSWVDFHPPKTKMQLGILPAWSIIRQTRPSMSCWPFIGGRQVDNLA